MLKAKKLNCVEYLKRNIVPLQSNCIDIQKGKQILLIN